MYNGIASAPIRAWKVAPSEGSWFIFLLCRLEERGAPHKPHLWNTWLLPLDVLYIYIYIRVLYYIRMPPYASMAPPRLARIHFRGLWVPRHVQSTCVSWLRGERSRFLFVTFDCVFENEEFSVKIGWTPISCPYLWKYSNIVDCDLWKWIIFEYR